MRYLGKKSLSSFLSICLKVSWYLILLILIAGILFGIITLYILQPEEHSDRSIERTGYEIFEKKITEINLENITNIPLYIKILMVPYFSVIMGLVLFIVKKMQYIFDNFKNNIVFDKRNVTLLSKLSILLIIQSIITFSISTLLVSILLLILCEIFKSGTTLQEENNLTI